MKKLILLLFMATVACANTLPGLPVEVSTQFLRIDEAAAIWMRIRNTDTNQMVPFFMNLDKKYNTQIFGTHAVRYQFVDMWLQFNNGKVTRPCHFSHDMLEKKATFVKLQGVLSTHPEDVVCNIAYMNAEPIPDFKPIVMVKKQKAKEVEDTGKDTTPEKYYAAVRECKPGSYQFSVTDPLSENKKRIVGIISGYKNGLCGVTEKQDVNVQGQSAVMESYCNYSSFTLSLFTQDAVNQIKLSFSGSDAAQQTPLQQARCKECTMTLDGVTTQCGEQFTPLPKQRVRQLPEPKTPLTPFQQRIRQRSE